MREPRVLVIDDDESIHRLLEIALGEGRGWEVRCVTSAQDALADARSVPPDVLLVDLRLRGMEGPEALALLRTGGVAAPAVLYTAALQAPDPAELAPLGVLGVLAKPFDPMVLSEQLARLLAQHQGGERDG